MRPDETALSPERVLMQMTMGAIVDRSLTLAAELGVADLLSKGPRSATELAEQLGFAEDGTYRWLRSLGVVGIFRELPGRRFELTALSEPLRSDAQPSMRAMCGHIGFSSFWTAMAAMPHALRTGKPSFDEANGMPLFEWFERNRREGALFNEAMTAMSAMSSEPVAKAYDFSSIGTLADIGGGQGFLLATILRRYPSLRGTLFDLPIVTANAQALLEAAGVADRVTVQPGNFFDGVPPGHDAYIMKAIIHDWDDARCIKLLRSCREGLNPGGRVLVVDQVVTDGPESSMAKLMDIVMMLIPGGKERTADELSALFAAAGLRLARIVPTETFVSVIEAVAA